ncbi:DNA ligase 4 [Irpex rosettiformis]|uniref:DNA ligase 4 n=1 Tax=Irpex rosettiformis TaxID=378272 RepID=A0ACB8UBU9_9APHY|nr:DNA ligase 4 [Irpex rosettiformis]
MMQQPTPAPSEYRSSPPPFPAVSQTQPVAVAEDHQIEYPSPPQNIGSAPFYVLSSLFDKLQIERKPDKRRKLLDSWFNHWREEKGFDLYPVLRLILPQKDRERSVYGLKEKNLAKIYIKLIPLNRQDPDSIRLLNWKRPSERFASSGDFPNVLYEVISKRSSVIQGSLSIDELNDTLDLLSEHMGKSDIQAKIMQKVYNRTTPEEQRWIVRIILKDMIISVKETTVFSVFHPDAQALFNTCSDLKKIAWELWDPKRRLNEQDKSVQLFHAFAPMLCKRTMGNVEESVKEMQGGKFIIEEKLDGERMQLHKRGNEYFYCSRKGKDYTYLYGKHVGSGSLTPFIDDAFDLRVDEIILDGEMLVWDPVSERNLPFGRLKTAALDKSKAEFNPRPCFKVFDLLYLNGMSLSRRSLKVRKKNLKSCISPIKGRIELATEFEGKTAQDVRSRMEEIIAQKGEGLVIKHPDSEYVLNGRNKDWIKVKPEYMDSMGETVDVLIVAGNYGTGRRSGGVSTLICAVREDRRQEETDDDDPKYSTFVRIGTGFSYADYIWMRQKPWKTWDPKNPPSFLLTSKRGQDDKGDMYLEPEDSFIVKVKAAEINASDQYHLGYTMRFPRAIAIRDDLGIADCMTASAVFEQMRSIRKRREEKQDGKAKKRRKIAAAPTVLPQYQSLSMEAVQVESNLFNGRKFMVASDPKSQTGDTDKAELQKLIKAYGGKCLQVANPKKPEGTMVVYDGNSTPYDIKLIMQRGVFDIVKPTWIKACVAKGEILPLRKKYFFHATESSQTEPDYDADIDDDDKEGSETEQSETEDKDVDLPTPAPAATRVSKEPDTSQIDPSLADWFQIDKKDAEPAQAVPDDDSETEPESDNMDTQDIEADPVDAGDDDWYQFQTAEDGTRSQSRLESQTQPETQEAVTMGESDTAMEYDQDLIFRHLCFYLDTPANARKNGMSVNNKDEDAIEKSFKEIAETLTTRGGKLVDLDDPKLTHIVFDDRDTTRRIELSKRTSTPKRRQLVLGDFVRACVEEDTLLDEDGFAP